MFDESRKNSGLFNVDINDKSRKVPNFGCNYLLTPIMSENFFAGMLNYNRFPTDMNSKNLVQPK